MWLVSNHPNLKKHQKQNISDSPLNKGMIWMDIHLASSCTNAAECSIRVLYGVCFIRVF